MDIKRKKLARLIAAWLFSVLWLAQQLCFCLFICTFLHIHTQQQECISTIVPAQICCGHSGGSHHVLHNHDLPGAAELQEDECSFAGKQSVPASAKTICFRTEKFCRYTALPAGCSGNIPAIPIHNMRC